MNNSQILNQVKVCSKCKQEKSLIEFPKVKARGKIYFRSICKECHKQNKKDYYEKNKKQILKKQKEDYYKNPEKHQEEYLKYKAKYPWRIVWKSIQERCYKPKTRSYKWYGGRGIKNYLTVEDVKFLWFRDNAYKMEHPTIDRENKNKDYTLDNCQFIEKSENSAKDKRKSVLQYSLDGKFIREFISVAEANRFFGYEDSHIQDVANGNRNRAFGFVWRYKE